MSASRLGGSVIGLLDVEPELGEQLSADERAVVGRVAVPVHTVTARELEVDQLLDDAGAFAAILLDGVLLHRMAIGEQAALRLLGPGDMLVRSGAARTGLLSMAGHRVSGQLRLALLDDRFLLTARRFPRLFVGLQVRLGEQHQRLAAQLTICQLPRVEDRLLAIMWLLAETWGRVTPSGTVLPMALTHDVLGELIGARRPTVTLALKELSERGALFRQAGEWLLAEPAIQGTPPPPVRGAPRLRLPDRSLWAPEPGAPEPARSDPRTGALPAAEPRFDQLASIISALRDSHVRSTGETRSRLDHARRTRERTRSLRERIASQRLSRRRAPAR